MREFLSKTKQKISSDIFAKLNKNFNAVPDSFPIVPNAFPLNTVHRRPRASKFVDSMVAVLDPSWEQLTVHAGSIHRCKGESKHCRPVESAIGIRLPPPKELFDNWWLFSLPVPLVHAPTAFPFSSESNRRSAFLSALCLHLLSPSHFDPFPLPFASGESYRSL